jgi:hypothetical protein
MTRTPGRRWTITRGLQEQLETAMASKIADHVADWNAQVAAGEIGEEARDVMAALGWLSSDRDVRLTLVETPKTKAGAA